jgi:hypothetical protein
MRRNRNAESAQRVLEIFGVRRVDGLPFISVVDIEAHEEDLLQLSGHLRPGGPAVSH